MRNARNAVQAMYTKFGTLFRKAECLPNNGTEQMIILNSSKGIQVTDKRRRQLRAHWII